MHEPSLLTENLWNREIYEYERNVDIGSILEIKLVHTRLPRSNLLRASHPHINFEFLPRFYGKCLGLNHSN